jgi:hypothetical protein
MKCSRSPWRLLSVFCVLALCLPVTPTIPSRAAVPASSAQPELSLTGTADWGFSRPAASPRPAGALYTVSDNPQRNAAAAEETASPGIQAGDETGSIPKKIAGVPGVGSYW